MLPTIDAITNNGHDQPLHGNHYNLCTGNIVVSGTTGFNPEDEGHTIEIIGMILKDLTASPAMMVTYGAPDAQGNRTYAATWPDYEITGSGQILEIKQAASPFGLTGATVNVS